MSDLPTAIKNLKYDKRMRDWNIKQKLLTEEEWRKRIAGLKDLSAQAEALSEEKQREPKKKKAQERAQIKRPR